MNGGGSRQRTLLIILGVVVVITAWVYLRPLLGFGGSDEGAAPPAAANRPMGEPGDEPAARPRPTARESHAARPGDRVAVLKMANLDHVPGDAKVGRDPWRFVDPPPPPPPPPPKPHVPTAAELEAERQRQAALAEQARLAAIEAAKPKPPPFNMEYLGSFGPPEKRIAVFLSGKRIVNALEGQVLDNKFIVAHIGYESVDIKFVGFPDEAPKRLGVRQH
ncbi:MAG TPA: hypothetical protein VFC23_19495 [Thermoanaerobaculia bacterium]|nr:hypothetical protein [Thermoanaerobaculia bacterium]